MTNEQLSSEQKAIKEMCLQRGITEVVHFTHVENVDSIMKHGLLSIRDLQQRGIRYRYNDQQRLDLAPGRVQWLL
ncbi:MAG: DarT ssDNA thymidine ADP-ribosyltransferase family protein [Fimbriimonadales bacterium]